MKKTIVFSILTSASLILGTAAFADSDGMSFGERQQVYQTASQSATESGEITASLAAPRQNPAPNMVPTAGRRPDLAVTDDEH